MPEEQSLAMLVEDLARNALDLQSAVKEKAWKTSAHRAKVILGLASRTYARLEAMRKALEELGLDAAP